MRDYVIMIFRMRFMQDEASMTTLQLLIITGDGFKVVLDFDSIIDSSDSFLSLVAIFVPCKDKAAPRYGWQLGNLCL